MDVIAAVVWHWWIALVLVLASIPAVIGTIVGYVNKVIAPRYGPRQRREPNPASSDEYDQNRR